jgi:hypothetical protein
MESYTGRRRARAPRSPPAPRRRPRRGRLAEAGRCCGAASLAGPGLQHCATPKRHWIPGMVPQRVVDAKRPTGRERDRSLVTLANFLIFHDFAEGPGRRRRSRERGDSCARSQNPRRTTVGLATAEILRYALRSGVALRIAEALPWGQHVVEPADRGRDGVERVVEHSERDDAEREPRAAHSPEP